MEDKYNWLVATKVHNGSEVKVRQMSSGNPIWVDSFGNEYMPTELDFTKKLRSNSEPVDLLEKMLSHSDVNAQADHQALIDEREYWRALRDDIFLELLRNKDLSKYTNSKDYDFLLSVTDKAIDRLYNHDKTFFHKGESFCGD